MKAICLVLAIAILACIPAGCVNVEAPQKVEIKADTSPERWTDLASRYSQQYANPTADNEN